MHLDDEQIQRLLAGEHPVSGRDRTDQHLRSCLECQSRVEAARVERDEISALLQRLDHPGPVVSAETVALRAQTRSPGWGKRVAAVALLLGLAGAVYALPNSPLRAWLKTVVTTVSDSEREPSRPGIPGQTTDAVSGIAAVPGSKLVISFTSPQQRGRARVRLVDTTEVIVHEAGGTGRFSLLADTLVVDNAGSTSSFEITIPRSAPLVTITVAQQRVFLKRGAVIETRAAPSTDGSYEISLAGTRPRP
jgi:hypothetical protein